MSAETTRILKANDLRSLGSKIVFNYEDIRSRCDEYIEKTRQEACRLLEEAAAEADQKRQRSHDEGFADGRKAGLQDAETEINRRAQELAEKLVAEKLRTTLPAIQATTAALSQERDRWLSEWEAAAVGLSVAIAEKLLRSELQHRPVLARDMLAQTLELAAGNPQIRVRLNPSDVDLLGEHADEVISTMSSCGSATILPDPSIAPGGCFIETQHGTIDARLETQLQRVIDELLQQS
jgi:flagellar assembly protein FliH